MSRAEPDLGIGIGRFFTKSEKIGKCAFYNKYIASSTKSAKNSFANAGFCLPQNKPTTNGFLLLLFFTEHKIGHKVVLELLKRGTPSTFICNSRFASITSFSITSVKPVARPIRLTLHQQFFWLWSRDVFSRLRGSRGSSIQFNSIKFTIFRMT